MASDNLAEQSVTRKGLVGSLTITWFYIMSLAWKVWDDNPDAHGMVLFVFEAKEVRRNATEYLKLVEARSR